jgi:RimJ/RimL family protein N-acetyltransferase
MIKSFTTSRGTIVIRQSSLADAANFRELRLGALLDSPTAFSMDHDRASHQSMKYWEDSLTMDDNESAIFFAEHEAHLIGMTGIARGRSPKTRHGVDVWGVYVAPEWRGLHIAEELIKSCLIWAKTRGVVIARLGVTAINQSAIRCYERCGFRIYATESRALLHDGKYYDFYMMSLSFDES